MLSGSTVGQSIATQLGLSPTTQISVTGIDARTLAKVLFGPIVMPTDFYGKGSVSGISNIAGFAPLAPNTYLDSYSGLGTGSNGTTYFIASVGTYTFVCCCTLLTLTNAAWIGMTAEGILEPIRYYAYQALQVALNQIIDSDNNIYTVGGIPGASVATFIKHDSSGNIVYARNGSGAIFWGGSTAINPTGNKFYSLGRNTAFTVLYILKTDNTFIPIWAYSFPSYGANNGAANIATDSNDNLYVTYLRSATVTTIIKLNSSGVFQSSVDITTPASPYPTYSNINVDSAGNVYLLLWIYPNFLYILKFNSSLTNLWQRQIANLASQYQTYHSKVDSSGNLYVTGSTDYSNYCGLYKYNSSGVLQWQRSLTFAPSTAAMTFNPIGLTDNTIQITISDENSTDLTRLWYVSVPQDGSKTGTYAVSGKSIVYAIGTSTESAASLTISVGAAETLTPVSITASDQSISSATNIVVRTGQVFL